MRALWSLGGEQAAERLETPRFEIASEGVVAPGVAHLGLRAGAVALRQQRAGERELPLGRQWRVLGKIGAHGRRDRAARPTA